MRSYFGIHNHTMYSNLRLLDCINRPQALIDKAIELNQIINNSDYVYSQDEITTKNLGILKEVSEWIR